MSSYHLSIKSGKKGKAVEHATYIAREGKHGKAKQSDLIVTVHGNLPPFANGDPIAFWRAADMYERANGAAYREYELALPQELSTEQQLALLNEFIKEKIGDKPYQFAIHSPVAALGGVKQPHGHLMVSDRKPDGIERPAELHFKRFNAANPELGGCKKDSGGKDHATLREELIATRATWAKIQNSSLEMHGHDGDLDHRSNKERGIDREAERHLGYVGIKKMSDESKVHYVSKRQSKPNTQRQRTV